MPGSVARRTACTSTDASRLPWSSDRDQLNAHPVRRSTLRMLASAPMNRTSTPGSPSGVRSQGPLAQPGSCRWRGRRCRARRPRRARARRADPRAVRRCTGGTRSRCRRPSCVRPVRTARSRRGVSAWTPGSGAAPSGCWRARSLRCGTPQDCGDLAGHRGPARHPGVRRGLRRGARAPTRAASRSRRSTLSSTHGLGHGPGGTASSSAGPTARRVLASRDLARRGPRLRRRVANQSDITEPVEPELVAPAGRAACRSRSSTAR